ncbi:MAG: hypothetical protein IJV04_06040, partial [Lachnospiraceae bacterium]|nr:hypothetical protein [Lachnospiraceae bacterium]
GQARNESRMENDIYSFIDLAVLIRRKEMTDENGQRFIRRFIDQLCYFERIDGENLCHMIVEDGLTIVDALPEGLWHKLQYAGLPDPMRFREQSLPEQDPPKQAFPEQNHQEQTFPKQAFPEQNHQEQTFPKQSFPSETEAEAEIQFASLEQPIPIHREPRTEEKIAFMPPRSKGTYRGRARAFV